MDKSLKNVREAHQCYVEKCNKVYKTCILCSESCVCQLAEVKANKNKSFISGGIAAAVGVTAAVLTPVAGPLSILGASYAGGIAGFQFVRTLSTLDEVQKFQRQEQAFKKMGLIFKELSNYGLELKHAFDDLHMIVERYEINHRIIIAVDRKDHERVCTTLERLKSLLQSTHKETSKARNTLKMLQNKV